MCRIPQRARSRVFGALLHRYIARQEWRYRERVHDVNSRDILLPPVPREQFVQYTPTAQHHVQGNQDAFVRPRRALYVSACAITRYTLCAAIANADNGVTCYRSYESENGYVNTH